MPRLLDLIAILAVAVVVLLPKASVEARPALEGDPVELDRVSRLQDDVFRHPDEVEPRLALADSFLSFFRADWAIATLQPLVEREGSGALPRDARVHLLLATAHAERLEPEATMVDFAVVRDACASAASVEGTPRCPAGTMARAQLISDSMKALLDAHIDPAREPQRAQDQVRRVLRPSRPGFELHRAPPPAR